MKVRKGKVKANLKPKQKEHARKGKRNAQEEIVQSANKNVRFHSCNKGTEKAQACIMIQIKRFTVKFILQRKNEKYVSISKVYNAIAKMVYLTTRD